MLNEAHHLLGLGALLVAFVAARARRWLGWTSVDAEGREIPPDPFLAPPRRRARWRSSRAMRLAVRIAPVVAIALALAWVGA